MIRQNRIFIVVRLRRQIYSAFASVAQRPCCAFGERLPTSCRCQIVQRGRSKAVHSCLLLCGIRAALLGQPRRHPVCAFQGQIGHALSHYPVRGKRCFAQKAMTEKMQASVRQRHKHDVCAVVPKGLHGRSPTEDNGSGR